MVRCQPTYRTCSPSQNSWQDVPSALLPCRHSSNSAVWCCYCCQCSSWREHVCIMALGQRVTNSGSCCADTHGHVGKHSRNTHASIAINQFGIENSVPCAVGTSASKPLSIQLTKNTANHVETTCFCCKMAMTCCAVLPYLDLGRSSLPILV